MSVATFLSALVVLGQLGVILGCLCLLAPKDASAKKVVAWIGKYAFHISFAAALVSTLGSLYYSEIAGYNPCKLCWYQRIFMYPQAILLWLGWRRSDKNMSFYALALSLIGGIIALYHYLLQIGIAPAIECSAVGYSESCSKIFTMTFGYITIPLMALTGFSMIIVSMIAYRRVHNISN